MPNYAACATSATPRRARTFGVLALASIVTLSMAGYACARLSEPEVLRIQLRTDLVGEGIGSGTAVRLDDVTVGEVSAVAAIGSGRQLLTIDLDRTQTAELTDTLTVDYAPQNLFGVSAVALRPGTGGTALRAGAVVDVAGRVTDATMGALLRQLTETSTRVLTPQLTDLVNQLSTNMRAFSPMLQALVALSRAVADTQQFASSYLIDQYAAFFHGFGEFSSATFALLDSVLDIEVFQTDQARYDRTINMVVDQAFPNFGKVGGSARDQFRGFTDAFAPLVAALAATVPEPRTSRAELTSLLDRLDRAFAETPDGPALNVAVTLRAVPGVAVALLGEPAFTALTEPGEPR
ncbi:MlaD family protein [Nocardia brasiliensis]